MKAPKFKDFITEQKKESYKLLVITDEPEKAKTFHTADRLREEAEKLGWKYYLYKLTGGYTTSPEGALRLHNKDDDKGFEVSGADTVAVQPDFELIAFDFVSNPSTHGAFMHPMTEGVGDKNNLPPYWKVNKILTDIISGV